MDSAYIFDTFYTPKLTLSCGENYKKNRKHGGNGRNQTGSSFWKIMEFFLEKITDFFYNSFKSVTFTPSSKEGICKLLTRGPTRFRAINGKGPISRQNLTTELYMSLSGNIFSLSCDCNFLFIFFYLQIPRVKNVRYWA